MSHTSDHVYNVLFICTGNSARSIIAESVLNTRGKGRFKAYSAGSHPSGEVNPLVLEFLRANRVSVHGARSKSWDEFATSDAPKMDFVITVCDQAAGETCPVWPGRPVVAQWSAPDPAPYMTEPDKARQIIREIFHLMEWRISLLTSLPVDKLDRLSLEAHTRAIADKSRDATATS
jgi:arsenate reductase (thioredoxin)